jgi:hypothetical protein
MSEVDQAQFVADHHMRVDVVSSKAKKVLIVVANPSTSIDDGLAGRLLGRRLRPQGSGRW